MLQHFHILFPFPFLNNSLLSYWVGVTEESYSHERVAGGGCWSPSRLRCAHLWGVGVEVPHFWCPKFSSSHVWMCELDHKEGCVLKNWCFQIMVLVKITRRSNQSILKEINPEYSLEGLVLKLKLQYFGHLTWRDDSLERLKEKGEESAKGWDG